LPRTTSAHCILVNANDIYLGRRGRIAVDASAKPRWKCGCARAHVGSADAGDVSVCSRPQRCDQAERRSTGSGGAILASSYLTGVRGRRSQYRLTQTPIRGGPVNPPRRPLRSCKGIPWHPQQTALYIGAGQFLRHGRTVRQFRGGIIMPDGWDQARVTILVSVEGSITTTCLISGTAHGKRVAVPRHEAP